MRVLFTFVGGHGHLDPLVPFARAAVDAGHDVTFSAQSGMVEHITGLGFTAAPSGRPTLFTERQPLLAPDREREQRAVRMSFAGPIASSRAVDLLDIIEAFAPDVLVCDEMDFGAMVAAERAGVPHASVVVIASGTFVDVDLVAEPLHRLRASHGLPHDPTMAMLTRHLVLCPVPDEFRHPDRALPATAHLVRPAVLETGSAVPVARTARVRPLVYVTLGTIFNLESGDLLARVVAAIRVLPIDVVVAVGPFVDPAELGPQPANVRVEAFVAQADVLRHAAVVVSHGGSGTVIGAIACGVPMAVIPLGADQLDNAERCRALGVATVLDPMTVSSDELRAAVDATLHDDAMQGRVAAMAAACAARPDAAHAVRLIESIARRGDVR
jgi:UDP:flavonoid glycosyltransferase YjiC (YdhE family)